MSMATRSDNFEAIYSKVDSLKDICKNMTVSELKGELGDRNLKVSGRKTFLVKRLLKSKIRELFVSKTNKDLRLELKNKGLPVSGTKDEKMDRLIANITESNSNKSSTLRDVDYSKMTISQLKKELKSQGLPVSGRKSELVKRLRTSDNSVDYSRMTVKELRVELRNQGKPVSGNKKTLVDRLKSSKTTLNYNYMTVKELRELLRSQGLKVSGNKAYLVSRLQSSDRNSMNYSGLPSDYAYGLDGGPVSAGKVVAGCIGFVLILGFIGVIFSEDSSYDDDTYYSSSSNSGSLEFSDTRNYGDDYSSGSSSSSYNSGSSSSSSSSGCYYYSDYAGRCLTESEYNCYFVTGGCSLYDDFGPSTGYSGDTSSGGSNSCVWAYDGVCDEGSYCSYGTDSYDCDSSSSSYNSGSSSSYNSGTSSSSSNCDAEIYYDEVYDIFYIYDPCTGSMYAY